MKKMKIIILVTGVMMAAGFIFWKDIRQVISSENTSVKSAKDEKAKDKPEQSPGIQIKEKWDLPPDLKEVSGIAYLDEQRFACIQDEDGTIFIYNRSSGQIEKEIQFAGPGDYEGITVKESTAYVVRADGRLYEVNMKAEKNSFKEYNTPLTVQQNIEGLCYDKLNDRLLLSVKDHEPDLPGYKGIYAFDLEKKTLNMEPVYKIDLEHPALISKQGKKNKEIKPSAIGIHPVSHIIYITDGPRSRLLTMDQSGSIKKLYELGKGFAQPEGITFSPEGEIFISNEGTKEPGNILKVEVQE